MQADTLKIMEYGLFDFCRAVQKAINEGYEFDFSTNESCPAAYGTHMECLMVKRKDQPEVVEVKPEEKVGLEGSVMVQARKAGRPAKA